MQRLLHLIRAVLLAGTLLPWELRALAVLLAWGLPNLLVAFVAPTGTTILLALAVTNLVALGLAWRRAHRLLPSRETEWARAVHPEPMEVPIAPADYLDTVPLRVGPHAPVATKRRTYIHDN
jgi:hypothetical protein